MERAAFDSLAPRQYPLHVLRGHDIMTLYYISCLSLEIIDNDNLVSLELWAVYVSILLQLARY